MTVPSKLPSKAGTGRTAGPGNQEWAKSGDRGAEGLA